MTELDARDALLLTLARICMATGTQAGANTDRLFTQIVAFEAVARAAPQPAQAMPDGLVERARGIAEHLPSQTRMAGWTNAECTMNNIDQRAALAALAPTQELPK
jgi:hypothetical protein